MATVTKQWSTGTGSVTLTYTGQGNGTISVVSDPNDLYVSRSMTITVATTIGGVSTQVTITQAACEPNFKDADGKWFMTSDDKYFNVQETT